MDAIDHKDFNVMLEERFDQLDFQSQEILSAAWVFENGHYSSPKYKLQVQKSTFYQKDSKSPWKTLEQFHSEYPQILTTGQRFAANKMVYKLIWFGENYTQPECYGGLVKVIYLSKINNTTDFSMGDVLLDWHEGTSALFVGKVDQKMARDNILPELAKNAILEISTDVKDKTKMALQMLVGR